MRHRNCDLGPVAGVAHGTVVEVSAGRGRHLGRLGGGLGGDVGNLCSGLPGGAGSLDENAGIVVDGEGSEVLGIEAARTSGSAPQARPYRVAAGAGWWRAQHRCGSVRRPRQQASLSQPRELGCPITSPARRLWAWRTMSASNHARPQVISGCMDYDTASWSTRCSVGTAWRRHGCQAVADGGLAATRCRTGLGRIAMSTLAPTPNILRALLAWRTSGQSAHGSCLP